MPYFLAAMLFAFAGQLAASDKKSINDRLDFINESYVQKPDESLKELLSLQTALDEQPDTGTQLKLQHVLCDLYEYRGLTRELLACSLRALGYADKIQDLHSLSIMSNTAGGAYEVMSDYKKAKEYYDKALEYARKGQDKTWQSISLKNQASIVERTGDGSGGLKLLQEAYDIARTTPDKDLVANVLNQTADLYLNLGRLEKAQTYFEEARQLYHDLGNVKSELVVQVNLGNAYKRNGQLDAAEAIYRDTISRSRQLNLPGTLAHSLKGMAHIADDRGQPDKAMQLFQECLDLFKETGESMAATVVKHSMAKILVKKSQFTTARKLMLEAVQAYEDSQLVSERGKALTDLSKIQFELQQYPEAYKSLQESFSIYQDLHNEKTMKASEELKIKFDTDFQEAKNKILELTNQSQKAQLSTQRLVLLLVGLVLLGLSAFVYFIVQKSRIIRKQGETIRMILANIEQGILLIQADRTIQGEVSPIIYRLLPDLRPDTALDLPKLLAALEFDGNAAALVEQSLAAALGENEIQWELNVAHLPMTVHFAGSQRTIEIEWKPIFNSQGLLATVMMVLRDATQRLKLEHDLHQENQRNRLVWTMLQQHRQSPEALARFFAKAVQSLQDIKKAGIEGRDDILQKLHSLKGNCRTLGFSTLAERVHAAESALKSDPTRFEDEWKRMTEALDAIQEIDRQIFLGDDRQRSDWQQLLALELSALRSMESGMEQAGLRWGRLTLENRFSELSAALLSDLTDIMIHAVSNAVDHGYLRPLQRGTSISQEIDLNIECLEIDGSLHGKISDRGIGLDENLIRRLAAEKKFVPGPGQSFYDVVLESEVSTASTLSETSGRGIGTTAIRSLVQGHGGIVWIHPAEPQGTCLQFRIPLRRHLESAS